MENHDIKTWEKASLVVSVNKAGTVRLFFTKDFTDFDYYYDLPLVNANITYNTLTKELLVTGDYFKALIISVYSTIEYTEEQIAERKLIYDIEEKHIIEKTRFFSGKKYYLLKEGRYLSRHPESRQVQYINAPVNIA